MIIMKSISKKLQGFLLKQKSRTAQAFIPVIGISMTQVYLFGMRNGRVTTLFKSILIRLILRPGILMSRDIKWEI